MSIQSVMPSNKLILCCPLLVLPSVFPSIRVFSSESALCIRWPKCWSFSFSISPSEEYSGLISFRMDWFDLLAAQGTLKSLLQHHILKELILQHSAFLMVQLSHPYITTGKTIALTIWTFVSKVISLLFNTLSRFVVAFIPRSKRLLISWLQSLSPVIFGAQENKVCHCFHFKVKEADPSNMKSYFFSVMIVANQPTTNIAKDNFRSNLLASWSLKKLQECRLVGKKVIKEDTHQVIQTDMILFFAEWFLPKPGSP